MSEYFKNIKAAARTIGEGMKLTLDHLADARKSREPIGVEEESYFDLRKGTMTLQYPHESLPVPDNGRYRLHNEVDDCIVCDKCAKICPVDCIDIEPVRSAEEFGKTSDGTSKRIYAAKFDIDMAKCCFCGLCTTVCPTECLTMTKVYDFSEYDVKDHNYAFGEMTPLEILEKKQAFEQYQKEKEEKAQAAKKEASLSPKPVMGKPKVAKTSPAKPIMGKPKMGNTGAKPVFKPKPMIKKKPKDDSAE